LRNFRSITRRSTILSIVVVATFRPLPEKRDEVLAAFVNTIQTVHAQEDGCELYALHTGRDSLIMIEKWADKDALTAHGSAAPYQALEKSLRGCLVEDFNVQIYRPHPAGDPEKGAL
jgi:quinol monooxygenase YgiN